jgi:DNA-binding PadR family transcriptional regulator
MDERMLLLLGILKAQSQHGYQINEFIEHNLGRVIGMKKPTAYALLERLSQEGYVTVRAEQGNSGPPRKVYAITPAGEALFLTLLRSSLAEPDHIALPGDIALMFLDHVSRADGIQLLQQRLAKLDAQIARYEQAPQHKHGIGVDLALARDLRLLQADRAWLTETLGQLEQAGEQDVSAS